MDYRNTKITQHAQKVSRDLRMLKLGTTRKKKKKMMKNKTPFSTIVIVLITGNAAFHTQKQVSLEDSYIQV